VAPEVADPLAQPLPRVRLATMNPHKEAELRRLVRGALGPWAGVADVLGAGDLVGYQAPAEIGVTYVDNARLKAQAVALRAPGEAVLADDSGIEVEALDGAPGVQSSCWVVDAEGRPLDASGLNRALLERLAGVPEERRGARMVATVVLWLPDGTAWREVVGTGLARGRVAHDARGTGGFGYDAVFVWEDGRRVSEVPAEVKDAVGHRGQAVRAVASELAAWIAAALGRLAGLEGPAAAPETLDLGDRLRRDRQAFRDVLAAADRLPAGGALVVWSEADLLDTARVLQGVGYWVAARREPARWRAVAVRIGASP
jgi:XTP/dITP diphosphohydrolase